MAVNFDFIRRLGAGYFGEVWLAIDTGLNVERAVKLIPPTKVLNPGNFFQEAQTLKALEHQNIIRVEETGTLQGGRIYVSMEFLKKGSLEDEARGGYLDLTRIKTLFIDILRGLGHAHSNGIVHRDIKPGNILIGDNREGKLSDFGLALPVGVSPKSIGVKDYIYFMHQAPEISKTNVYTIQSDIYACGVTLYRLINGDSYLPSASSPQEIRKLTILGKFPDRTKYREFVPRSLKTIVNRAMNIDPAKRYQTADELRHALERLPVEKNWRETSLPNGKRWTCGWGNACYEVFRFKDQKHKWNVTVKKGSSKNNLRRIRDLCSEGLSKKEAEKHSRKLLQDFLSGKLT